jgi:hypothetical protein
VSGLEPDGCLHGGRDNLGAAGAFPSPYVDRNEPAVRPVTAESKLVILATFAWELTVRYPICIGVRPSHSGAINYPQIGLKSVLVAKSRPGQ